jgi:HEAT repeat protein
VGILGGIAFLSWSHREPVYKGKSLSYWLRAYDQTHIGSSAAGPNPDWPTADDANEAIQNLGTNALPVLLKYLLADESHLAFRMRNWVMRSRFNEFALKRGLVQPIPGAWIKNNQAATAFRALGTNASVALPVFIKMCNTDGDFRSFWAVQELGVFGPAAKDGVPVLVRIATTPQTNNPNLGKPWVRPRVGDPMMRMQACRALGRIHSQPELAVPALVRCATTDASNFVRQTAFEALAEFGADARAAKPALTEFIRTNTFDIHLKFAAEAALKSIDPSAPRPTIIVPLPLR